MRRSIANGLSERCEERTLASAAPAPSIMRWSKRLCGLRALYARNIATVPWQALRSKRLMGARNGEVSYNPELNAIEFFSKSIPPHPTRGAGLS